MPSKYDVAIIIKQSQYIVVTLLHYIQDYADCPKFTKWIESFLPCP